MIALISRSPVLIAQQYNFVSISIGEGLPQSQVQAISQDHAGYLWIGTNGGGICRYDGLTFTTWTVKHGLSSNRINDLAEFEGGSIWACTDNGVSILKAPRSQGQNISIKNLQVADGLPSAKVYTAAADAYGNIWLGTDRGVAIYNGEELVSGMSLPTEKIRSILVDGNREIWFGGAQNLWHYDGEQFRSFPLEKPNTAIHSLAMQPNDVLLVGTANGVYEFTGGQFRLSDVNKHLGTATVFDIYTDGRTTYWFGTNTGLYRYNLQPSGMQLVNQYGLEQGLASSVIYNIFKDKESNYWLGTNGAGIVRFTNERFVSYPMKKGEDVSLVYNIRQDGRGRIWFGTYTGLYFMDKDNTIEPFVVSNFFRQFRVPAVHEDSRGRLWYGILDYGLFKWDGKEITQYTVSEGLSHNNINDIAEDLSGNLWLATDEGFCRFNGKSFKRFNRDDGLINDKVNAITIGGSGEVWLGTEGGLTRYDPAASSTGAEAFTHYTTAQGLSNNNVKVILSSAGRKIWLGTDEGISFFNPEQPADSSLFVNISTKDGLSSNLVNAMIPDDAGFLWIGTNKGLDRFDVNKFHAGGAKHFIHYGKDEGFTGIECNRNAVMKDHAGNLWFGTIKGAIKYNPKEDRPNLIAPDLHIENIRLFFDPFQWDNYSKGIDTGTGLPQKLVLPYDLNYLSFDFTGINLSAPEKVNYQVKLEGYDKSWQPASNKRSINYSNLGPGAYTFKVRSANNNGIWNEQPVAYAFTIAPPFWKETGFILAVSGIGLALVALIFYWFFNRKVKKKELQEKIAELKLNALRAQMNPHFIFNSLNSIQNFINKNDEESANIYLAKFASLMRMILDTAQRSAIPVSEEIKSLELYLELEKLRFKNKFDYSIDIDQGIDPAAFEIPTMLIQPYVENAINHGIMHKEGSGHIKIALQHVSDGIICTIEDDGIGRDQARQIKARQQINHRSVGMGITKDRLQIINLVQKKNMSVKVSDMVNGNQQPAGTRVEIHIPVISE